MPRHEDGEVSLTRDFRADDAANQPFTGERLQEQLEDLATIAGDSLSRDGQGGMRSVLEMGGNPINNAGSIHADSLDAPNISASSISATAYTGGTVGVGSVSASGIISTPQLSSPNTRIGINKGLDMQGNDIDNVGTLNINAMTFDDITVNNTATMQAVSASSVSASSVSASRLYNTDDKVSLGAGSNSYGAKAITLGDNSIANNYSMSLGTSSSTTGTFSSSVGMGASCSGTDSVSLGYSATNTTSQRIVIGKSDTRVVMPGGYGTTSDSADKANIEGLKYGLDLICKLKPRSYVRNPRDRYYTWYRPAESVAGDEGEVFNVDFVSQEEREADDKAHADVVGRIERLRRKYPRSKIKLIEPEPVHFERCFDGAGEVEYDSDAHSRAALAGTRRHFGLVAQEVRDALVSLGDTALTSALLEDENCHKQGVDEERWTLDYVQVIPVLINAVQELSARVETLEAQANKEGNNELAE